MAGCNKCLDYDKGCEWKMEKWIVLYDSKGKELAAYTERGTFEGELAATIELLAYERNIPVHEIIIGEVVR